jgi:hypothetical protein
VVTTQGDIKRHSNVIPSPGKDSAAWTIKADKALAARAAGKIQSRGKARTFTTRLVSHPRP